MKTRSRNSSRSLRLDRDDVRLSFARPSRRRSSRTWSVPPPKRTAESPTAPMTPGSIPVSGSGSRPRIVAGGDGEAIRDLVGEPATSRGAPAGPPSVAEPVLRVPEQGARRGSHHHDPGNPAGGDGGAAGGLAGRFSYQSRQPAHGREASAYQARRLAEINP